MLLDFFVKLFTIKCSICIISIFDFFLVEINYHKNKTIWMLTYTTYFTSWLKSITAAVNFIISFSLESVNMYWYLRLEYTAVSMFWYAPCGITSVSMKKWVCLCTGHGMKVNITTSICWCHLVCIQVYQKPLVLWTLLCNSRSKFSHGRCTDYRGATFQ